MGTKRFIADEGIQVDNIQIAVSANGEIDTSSGNLTIDSAGGTTTVDDNLTVTGNLTVSGTTTTVNTATLSVADNIVTLNSDYTSGAPTENAGIEVLRGSSSTVAIRWNETNDKWEATNDGTTYGNVVTTADSGTVTSAMIADGAIVNADVNSSASIALSKLASGTSAQVIVANSSGIPTYTTLSGDVTISNTGVTTIAADSVALGTDTTGNYVASLVAGTGVTLSNNTGEGATPTVAIGQAVATTSEVTFANVKTTSSIELATISATAATGTIALDVANGTTYYTSNATANWTVNLRWNSSTSLDSKLAVGEMATTTFMVTNGGTAYYASAHQIAGSAITPKWQGGSAPAAGNTNSIDMYTYTVVKTASNTFTLFAALSRFA